MTRNWSRRDGGRRGTQNWPVLGSWAFAALRALWQVTSGGWEIGLQRGLLCSPPLSLCYARLAAGHRSPSTLPGLQSCFLS